jgi:TonB family protein
MGGLSTLRTDSISPGESHAKLAERLDCVSDDSLREIVQKAARNTRATGAAMGLGSPGEMVCRATAGDCPSEIGAQINSASGVTGLCVSSGTIQYCKNTELDARVDADSCRALGIASIIVAPVFCQGQLLGLIEVFSHRPYAFGMRDLQALEALAEEFSARLQLSAESRNDAIHEVRSVSDTLGGERNRDHFARIRKIGVNAVAVVAFFLIGLRGRWKPSRWLFLLLSAAILVAVLWWHWNRGWEDLESGLQKNGKTMEPQRPQAHVPADEMEKLVTHRVDPEYPGAARPGRLQGVIALDVVVGRDGSVLEVQALNGPEVLAQAAMDALRWWRFQPYRVDGQPVVVETTMAVEFKP